MGYKIYYGKASIQRKPWGTVRRFLLTVGFFALFILTAQLLLPAQLHRLREALLPTEGLENLVRQLQQGKNIVDAVTAFCHDIIHDR